MPAVTKYTSVGTVTLTHVGSPPPAGNDLATAAQGLAAGASAPFNSPNLTALLGTDIMDWATRLHWDSVRLKAHFILKAANAIDTFKYYQFDAATNVITKLYDGAIRAGGGNGNGHAYDCAALDEATGDFYFLAGYAHSVVKWNGAGFSLATGRVDGGAGSGNDSSSPRGISWHPNLYGPGQGGLIHVRGSGSGGGIMAWKKSLGSGANFTRIGTVPYSGIRHSQAVYCAALDQQIVSLGDAGLACMRVIGGTTPTVVRNLNDFPVFVTAFYDSAADPTESKAHRMLPMPDGSVGIFESATPGQWWWMDPVSLQFKPQAGNHPMRLTNRSWPTGFISNYGVYWALREVNNGSSIPNSLLFRPNTGV